MNLTARKRGAPAKPARLTSGHAKLVANRSRQCTGLSRARLKLKLPTAAPGMRCRKFSVHLTGSGWLDGPQTPDDFQASAGTRSALVLLLSLQSSSDVATPFYASQQRKLLCLAIAPGR
jgi:hypothetical protein